MHQPHEESVMQMRKTISYNIVRGPIYNQTNESIPTVLTEELLKSDFFYLKREVKKYRRLIFTLKEDLIKD